MINDNVFSKPNEVIFVYLGNTLPDYAIHSIRLATKYSGLRVRLIASQKLYSKLPNLDLEFTSLNNFYDETPFINISNKILMPKDFRNAFWLKTLERFYVLHQFMKAFNLDRIFHAELDQLLFRCDTLLHNLDQLNHAGVLLPFHDPTKAVASIFYCNDADSLSSILDFADKSHEFENEMRLIALWAENNSNKVKLLPTVATEIIGTLSFKQKGLDFIDLEDVSGVCDAAQLGQWVGGQDPRNVPISQKPKNKYVEPKTDGTLDQTELEKIKIFLDSNKSLVGKLPTGFDVRIYNIHLHSKIHAWVERKPDRLEVLLRNSNKDTPTELPLARRIQILYFVKTGVRSLLANPKKVILRKFINPDYGTLFVLLIMGIL